MEASLHLRYVSLLALVNTMLILYVSSLTVLISKNNLCVKEWLGKYMAEEPHGDKRDVMLQTKFQKKFQKKNNKGGRGNAVLRSDQATTYFLSEADSIDV